MSAHHLVSSGVRDFTLDTIDKMSDAQVHGMFAQARWGSTTKQTCPECGTVAAHYWKTKRRQWMCRELGCSRTFSVISGTKFEDSKLPLRKLLRIVFTWVSNAKGISAVQMANTHGVKHQHVWVLMHKLREAIMVTTPVTPLGGVVHVDGSHVGGRPRKGRDGRPLSSRNNEPGGPQARDLIGSRAYAQHPNRRIVMVAREVEPGVGGLRSVAAVVRREANSTVVPFVRTNVQPGAILHTDELGSYNILGLQYDHRSVNHSNEFQTDDGVDTNQAESFFTRVKRFYMGTVHRLTPKYLAGYMAEMVFREDNRRKTNRERLEMILRAALQSGRSEEILFPTPIHEVVARALVAASELLARQIRERLAKRAARRAWPEAGEGQQRRGADDAAGAIVAD